MEEFNQLLLAQIKERDEMIKSLVESISRLTESYITKDKEYMEQLKDKDKRHSRTIIIILLLGTMFISLFTYSYFYSNYTDHSTNSTTINGTGNNATNINGNNDTNSQNK